MTQTKNDKVSELVSPRLFTERLKEWKTGENFYEYTHLKLRSHTIKKVTQAFCGACNRQTTQLQSATNGLDNDYSLFCTRCEVKDSKTLAKLGLALPYPDGLPVSAGQPVVEDAKEKRNSKSNNKRIKEQENVDFLAKIYDTLIRIENQLKVDAEHRSKYNQYVDQLKFL